MYCINCGVRLEDTEKVCPLCHTTVPFHPDIERKEAESLYGANDDMTVISVRVEERM